jgi:DNA-binding MarR family transcriptional regulator
MSNVREKANPAAGQGDERRRYVDDTGQMFARYGAALTVGRLFGLLLVSDDPVSLDDIASQLRVSKSSASVAARDLERLGVARRLHTRGSRRVLYTVNEDMDPTFEAALTRIRDGLVMVRRGEPVVGEGKAKDRLRLMAEFYEFWLDETVRVAERWKQRRI